MRSSRPYHHQHHLEPVDGLQSMWLVGRHNDRVALLQMERLSRYGDLGVAVQNGHHCIEWGRVLAQTLPRRDHSRRGEAVARANALRAVIFARAYF